MTIEKFERFNRAWAEFCALVRAKFVRDVRRVTKYLSI
jgi:hypothetical protein